MFKINRLILLIMLLLNVLFLVSCTCLSHRIPCIKSPPLPILLPLKEAIPKLTRNLLKQIKSNQNCPDVGNKTILLGLTDKTPPGKPSIDNKSIYLINNIKELIIKEGKVCGFNIMEKPKKIEIENVNYSMTAIISYDSYINDESYNYSHERNYNVNAFISVNKKNIAEFRVWISDVSPPPNHQAELTAGYQKESIVKIESKGRKGVGFIIAKDQKMKEVYIITAEHILHPQGYQPDRHPQITFHGRSNTKFNATVIEVQQTRKIGSVILEVDKVQEPIFSELTHLYLEDCKPKDRDDFHVYTRDLSADIIYFSKKEQDRYKFSNGMINEGSSGTPVIKPNTIIACAMIQEVGNNAAYGTPTDNILSFLEGISDGKRIIKLMRTSKCKRLRGKIALMGYSYPPDDDAIYLKTQCKDIF
ncbi:MAG: hypothetical protein SVR94_01725 [Pseudomonadota bacterium]|nr:hypothetical protein [Pseudomonadota bacterium]